MRAVVLEVLVLALLLAPASVVSVPFPAPKITVKGVGPPKAAVAAQVKTVPLSSSLLAPPPPKAPAAPTNASVAVKGKRLLVGVETAPAHTEARNAIRATYAKVLNPSSPSYDARIAETMDVKFFVGELGERDKTLASTIASEKDMVRLNGFVESYGNLSAKTLGIVSWAFDNNYQHVLKVDDDVFLQLDLLMQWLSSVPLVHAVYGGEFVYDAEVNSNPKSKWYMRDQYPSEHFPPYAFGSCYFLGSSLVSFVATHRDKLKLFRVEDAGMSIWLREGQVAIREESIENMYFQAECWDAYSVFTTPVNAKEMYALQTNKEWGNMCQDKHGKEVVLDECVARRCRCYPLPDSGACESSLANDSYEDLIPRLVQVDAAVTA